MPVVRSLESCIAVTFLLVCATSLGGRGNRGARTRVIGLEQHGSGAVLPDIFQPQLQPAVVAQLESVLREGRPGDVAGEPFELTPITSIDELLGVYVDAEGFRHAHRNHLGKPLTVDGVCGPERCGRIRSPL